MVNNPYNPNRKIKPSEFGVAKPPDPYPDPEFDRVKNLYKPDKDFSKWSNMAPEEVNKLHMRSDADKGLTAQHHTLGIRRFQASPGDHIHNGTTSKKLATGLGYTLTGAKGGNVALTNLIAMLKNLIEFTDSTT